MKNIVPSANKLLINQFNNSALQSANTCSMRSVFRDGLRKRIIVAYVVKKLNIIKIKVKIQCKFLIRLVKTPLLKINRSNFSTGLINFSRMLFLQYMDFMHKRTKLAYNQILGKEIHLMCFQMGQECHGFYRKLGGSKLKRI